ncbi:MAG: cation:proton antiporter [Bacteroidales bacterium]|nr:cation:proton antiporter [Bacteroidales bacterium]
MEGVPALFFDLALILITAGITTVIFKWLKQPLVLGYIVAGFLIGPHFTYFPVVEDPSSVETWSEIGMVFLLFAIGLEFSFKKLKKVGGPGAIMVLTELIIMFTTGFFVGKLFGWQKMNCIFLGCMLSISSTSIIVKAFDDLKLKSQKFTADVIGALVVEDLVAVILMVILSTLSVGNTFNGGELVLSMVKLMFFLVIWFIFGIYLIPSFLRLIRKFMTEETLVIIGIGLCFMMVMLANYAGFSSALGAFVMGSILAETLEADIIHKLVTPIKNLFAAIFFVSVGMMVDPKILVDYTWPVVIIALTIMIVKTLSATFGMLISGRDIHTSLKAGFCFCQIGEFSFIIASLGLSFKVIDEYLYPIIVTVSIVTTFFTPYIIRLANPLYNWLNPRIPERWKQAMTNYSEGFKLNDNTTLTFKAFVINQFKNMVIYGCIIFALALICYSAIGPFVVNNIKGLWGGLTSIAITLAILAPFVWAMAFKYKISLTNSRLISKNLFERHVIASIFILRYIIAIFIITNILRHFISINFFAAIGIAVVISLILAFSNSIMKFYDRLEKNFMENLNKRQKQASFIIPEVLQQNFHLEKVIVSPLSQVVGKQLKNTVFRSQYKVSVVSIERGNTIYDLPDKDIVFYPYDIVTLVGSDENINKVKPIIEVEDPELIHERKGHNMSLHSVTLSDKSPICQVSLLNSLFKDKYDAMVIAIQRGNDFILSPSAATVFHSDDVIWFVSTIEAAKMIKLKEEV